MPILTEMKGVARESVNYSVAVHAAKALRAPTRILFFNPSLSACRPPAVIVPKIFGGGFRPELMYIHTTIHAKCLTRQ